MNPQSYGILGIIVSFLYECRQVSSDDPLESILHTMSLVVINGPGAVPAETKTKIDAHSAMWCCSTLSVSSEFLFVSWRARNHAECSVRALLTPNSESSRHHRMPHAARRTPPIAAPLTRIHNMILQ